MEELSTRFESTCGKIQDSIAVIESQMGSQEVFSFDINGEIYELVGADINTSSKLLDRYIIVLEEYKKILGYEKTRRRLEGQMKKTEDMKTLKETLKRNCQNKILESNPYKVGK